MKLTVYNYFHLFIYMPIYLDAYLFIYLYIYIYMMLWAIHPNYNSPGNKSGITNNDQI